MEVCCVRMPESVAVSTSGSSVLLKDGGRRIFITPKRNENIPSILNVLNTLRQGNIVVDELIGNEKNLSETEVRLLISKLDSSNLILLGGSERFERNGSAVIRRLERASVMYRFEQLDRFVIAERVTKGIASKNLLIGVAFEYYHITSRAYDAILPVIGNLHGPEQDLLLRFALDEYRHDRITIRAVRSLGYSDDDIHASIPLPYTSALVDTLEYWGRVDPLAFIASLFVFEGKEESELQFIKALEKYDLPRDYIKSFYDHQKINSDSSHESISRDIFSKWAYLSVEQEERLLSRLIKLHNLLFRRDEEMLEYYENDGNVVPRISHKMGVPV